MLRSVRLHAGSSGVLLARARRCAPGCTRRTAAAAAMASSSPLVGPVFFLDDFAIRQWDDPNYSGTRLRCAPLPRRCGTAPAIIAAAFAHSQRTRTPHPASAHTRRRCARLTPPGRAPPRLR